MDAQEVRRILRKKLVDRLFGEDYRADLPASTLGGEIGWLASGQGLDGGLDDIGTVHRRLGKIEGLKLALELLDDAAKEAIDPPREI